MSLWHTLTSAAIAQELQTDLSHGLSSDEARKRLATYGANALPEKKKETILHIFISQFQSPLIFVLVGACLILFLLHEFNDALIIAFILGFNAVLGTIQEGRAQNTLAALKKFITTQATVLRDKQEIIIPDNEIVPGDILIVKEGEKVPADARIIESFGLRVDESAITGESGVVNKSPALLKKKDTPVADRKNILLKGSSIVGGNGLAICVATGTETEIGKVSTAVATMDTDIPLKQDIKNLSQTILKIVAATCAGIFLLGVVMGNSAETMFATVVSMAVSLIPEGLPIVVTLILANGVWYMARRNALVKKMQAVEALGQAHIIAVDKTGTITCNELTTKRVYTQGVFFDVSGVGYDPKGTISRDGRDVVPAQQEELLHINKLALLSSNAHVALQEDTHEWKVNGDPTEAAMVVLSEKIGISKEELEQQYPRVSELPFDYKVRYHATLHKDKSGYVVALAGAPEAVIALSKNIRTEKGISPLTADRKKLLEEAIFASSQKGYRVICFGSKKLSLSDASEFNATHINELCLEGFYCMEDSLRSEVRAAVQKAQTAGVQVVMITGDHALTAQAIATQAGIYRDGDHILTGEELEYMSAAELDRHLPTTTVFARVTPAHKMILVQGYKRIGKIIAMTGDGVNDAPALVAADLGISMGKIGTEVAKEASDIILLDDNFTSIVSAIEEGRRIFYAMRRVLFYLFSTSLAESTIIGASLLFGLPLPLLPAQIIWLNLITDGFLVLALGMERRGGSHFLQKMLVRSRTFIDKTDFSRIFLISMWMSTGTLLMFISWYAIDMPKALTLSLTTLAAFQWFNAFNTRSNMTSLFRINPFSNRYLIGAICIVVTLQFLALTQTFLQEVLSLTHISLAEWASCIAIASTIIIPDEVRKFFARRKAAKTVSAPTIALATKSAIVSQ